MQINRLTESQTYPSVIELIGSNQSQAVIDEINTRWGGSETVSFGQASNPMNERYHHFMNVMNNTLAKADSLIREVTQSIMYPDHWRPILDEAALQVTPECMQPALLMTPGIFDLFKQRKISGWNWNPDTFPDVDLYGKQLSNGVVMIDPRDPSTLKDIPDVEWNSAEDEFYGLTDEQKDALEQSRNFLTTWLENELGENGIRRDPTDLGNTISV
jgi:hypothetical protein